MTSFTNPSYQIERPGGRCAMTGRPLTPGEPYVATLVDDGEALRRLDISLEAWQNDRRPDHLFSFWKSTYPDPKQKKKVFVDDDVLMNLLRRLEDAEQPQRIAFRFVLTLILMRKRLLRYDRTEKRPAPAGAAPAGPDDDDGAAAEPAAAPAIQEWWVLTPKLDLSKGPLGKWNEDETIEVLDPRLDEAQVREVTDQLGEILNAEL